MLIIFNSTTFKYLKLVLAKVLLRQLKQSSKYSFSEIFGWVTQRKTVRIKVSHLDCDRMTEKDENSFASMRVVEETKKEIELF